MAKYDERMVKRVARKLYEIFYGPRAYKKIIKPKKKKKITTLRTGAVQKYYKKTKALTKEELARFRD